MHSFDSRLLPFLLTLAAAPLAAQAPLAATQANDALGSVVAAVPAGVFVDRPRADEPTRWVRGDRYKASIDGAGMTFIPYLGAEVPQNQPIRFRLAAVRCADRALDATARAVAADGARVTVRRTDFDEVYDARPEGLEQSFRFDRLPVRGELVIELAFAGEVAAAIEGDDLRFHGAYGDVRYSGLVAIDARGMRAALPIGLDGDRIVLRVPAEFVAAAALPLVVDPVAATATVASVPDQRMEPDLAWNETGNDYLVVWRVPFSATDWDVAAVQTTGTMTPIGAPFWIDYTAAHWEHPKVASKRLEGMYLVTGQVSSGAVAPYSILGRRYESSGGPAVLHPQFDVQRAGVANHLAGDAFRPDVSGDPWMGGGPAYFTVVWEHHLPGGNGDIVFRQLYADGTFVTPAPVTLNSGPYDDREPSISKSPGQGVYGVVWSQWNGLGGAGDIVAAEITYDGLVLVSPFFLDSSTNDDSRPRISTPADGLVPGVSLRTFLVVWQRNFDPFANAGRLHCAAITNDFNAPLINRWDLTALLGVPSATMAYQPVVDSDGTRFAVACTELPAAAPGQGHNDVRASTLALRGTQLLVHENRLLLSAGGAESFSPSIASRYGGSLANSRAYGVVAGTSAISVMGWVYDGRQAGTLWNTRGGGCGGLQLTYSGLPTLGDSVTIDLAGPAPFRAILFGFPAPLTPLLACPGCAIGVTGGGTASAPFYWQIPYVPGLVGLTLSAQGFTLGSGPCLGALALTDTLDFTVR